MTAPKVFVSHASEDKVRFVVGFAQRLRENGVDAWLDATNTGEPVKEEIYWPMGAIPR